MDNGTMNADNERGSDSKGKIYWHGAYYEAIQFELIDYEDSLIFEDEHQLSKEALIMDMLIIKKRADVEISKNIGKLFKRNNVVEIKSETDYLSIRGYHKVVGYALIYSAFENIPIDDITISFLVTPKPIKLIGYLEKTRGFKVREAHSGIYYVEGDTFPIQIIESKRLPANENIFLRNLRSSLTEREAKDTLNAYKKIGSLERGKVYLDRLLEANWKVFEEVIKVDGAVKEIIYEYMKKDGIIDEAEEKGKREGKEEGKEEGKIESKRDTAYEMLNDGFPPEKVARYVKMPVEWVESLTQ